MRGLPGSLGRVYNEPMKDRILDRGLGPWGRSWQVRLRPRRTFALRVLPFGPVCLLAPQRSQARHWEEIIALRSGWIRDQALLARAKAWLEAVGVDEVRLGLSRARTRFGSCMVRKRRILLSERLVFLSRAEQRLVVLHEAAHLWVPHHGPAFYQHLESWCPGARQAQRALRQKAWVLWRNISEVRDV